jgi:hypothetical protein
LSTGMYVSYQTIICHLFAYVQVVASQRLAWWLWHVHLWSSVLPVIGSCWSVCMFPLILPHVSTHFIHNATCPKSCHEALEVLYQNSLYLFITQIIKYNMRRKETVHNQLISNSKSPGKMTYACKCCCHFAVAVWIFLR